MKYSNEIEINLPIEKVVALFDNPNNMSIWMEGLQSFEHLSGTPGQSGARSKLIFNNGNRTMEMTETIITRNLPDEFTGSYETKGVYNIVSNKFIPLGPYQTKYISEQEFEFSGIMKLIAFLMPGAFKKQSMKYLENFKKFAEGQP